jgi:hypothetical protein
VWIELIQNLSENCDFSEPTALRHLNAAEIGLGRALPDELRALLSESNGIQIRNGARIIWSLKEIVHNNLLFWQSGQLKDGYMPFNHLLFFGEDRCGNQFAFPIQANGDIHRTDVFLWNYKDDSRTWIALSLRDYLEQIVTGKIVSC